MALSQYNKDRPFLIVIRNSKPKKGVKTEVKGWTEGENWQIEEMVSIVDRITNKHMTEAMVIIDILKRDLVKSRFADQHENEVLAHYLKTYKSHIAEGLSIWMRGKIGDPEEAQILIHDLEDEIGKMEKLHRIPVKIEHEDGESNEEKIVID